MIANIQIKCPKNGDICNIDLDEQFSDKLKEETDKITKIKDEENQNLREQLNKKNELDKQKLSELCNIEREAGKYEAIKN